MTSAQDPLPNGVHAPSGLGQVTHSPLVAPLLPIESAAGAPESSLELSMVVAPEFASAVPPLPEARKSLLIARFLRMLSILLEQLQAIREANARAEFAGLTHRAHELEAETNALECEMEELCLAAFADPTEPKDLAFKVMIFRSLANLERVGDYAFQVARDLETFAPRVRSATLQDVLPLIQLLSEMVEHLAYAFAERDADAARLVQRLDYEQVDALYEQMQRASLTRLLERPEDNEVALTAGRMARNLERLGDHLVSVAERLERLIEGAYSLLPTSGLSSHSKSK